MADSSYGNEGSDFDKETLDTAQKNWENRQNRQFENSDLDSDKHVSEVPKLLLLDESSRNSNSKSKDSHSHNGV